jgi:hypothetical protein
MNVKRIERFTKQLIPVEVVVGFEAKRSAAPRSSAKPGGWKPGDGRSNSRSGTGTGYAGSGKPAQRTFSKPNATPAREGGFNKEGGGYKGNRSSEGSRRSFSDR